MTAPPDDSRAGQRFPKDARLLRRAEFLTVQSKGQRVHTANFTLALRDRGDGAPPRLGVTASRKAANSVGRNRVRRLVREVFRVHRAVFPAGCDCVVIVHEKVPELDLATVRDELLGALARRRGRSGGRPAGPGASTSGPSGPTGQTPAADTKKPHAAPTSTASDTAPPTARREKGPSRPP